MGLNKFKGGRKKETQRLPMKLSLIGGGEVRFRQPPCYFFFLFGREHEEEK